MDMHVLTSSLDSDRPVPVYRMGQSEFVVPLHVYFPVLYYESLSATDQEDKGPCLPVCVRLGSGGGRHAGEMRGN